MNRWEQAAEAVLRKTPVPTNRLTNLWTELNHRDIPYDQDHRRLSFSSTSSSSSEERRILETDEETDKEKTDQEKEEDGEKTEQDGEKTEQDAEHKDGENENETQDGDSELVDENDNKSEDLDKEEDRHSEDILLKDKELSEIYKELGIIDYDAEERKVKEQNEIKDTINELDEEHQTEIKEKSELNDIKEEDENKIVKVE